LSHFLTPNAMFALLEQLRKKPAVVRHHIALAISGGFTFFLLILWFGSFDARFTPTDTENTPKPPTDALLGTVKGFTETGGSAWKSALEHIASTTPVSEEQKFDLLSDPPSRGIEEELDQRVISPESTTSPDYHLDLITP
jgi:hypothetical protein